jgi:heptosyltransferase-2
MVMCQSLFMTLRARWPDATLDALAPDSGRALLARMPEVDDVIALPVGHGELRPLAQWRAAREVRRRGYDRAIVTRRSAKSALVPWLAGVPRRTGIRGERPGPLLTDVREVSSATHAAAVERLAVLGLEPGATPGLEGVPWPRLTVEPARGAALEEAHGLAGPGAAVGLAPGAAYGPAKRWPLESWGRLARRLVGTGRRVWVFGSADEAPEGERIAAAAGDGAVSLCGRTSLVDVVDLMGRCRAVVSNDSGLMHVAAASGPRVVAIFGSTSPANTPPLSRDARILWLGLSCSPCYQRECPLGHLRCLRDISVDEVLDAVSDPAGSGEAPGPHGTDAP